MKVKLKPKTASFECSADEVNKVVLLYSGGLDTSVMIKWLQDAYNCEVVTMTADLGQPEIDLEAIKQKALALGASKAFIVDLKKEFAEEYIAPAIKANALYQGKYPLSTALGRPLIAKYAVQIAEQEKADAICHGCTGKGNDQVRLDSSVLALSPGMKIIAPVREWDMCRDEEIQYAEQHNIPIPVDLNKPYSIDENMWGKSSECGILEHPDEMAPDDVFTLVTLPENAPDKAEIVSIGFEQGVPIALNGQSMPLHELILQLNDLAGKHGVGIIDHTEDRIVGLKSREIYECPAAVTIIKAHLDLEKFVSTIHENHFKPSIDNQWSYLCYAGLWFDPLMKNLSAFADKMNENVSGEVKVKLYKGQASVVARKSPHAIYDLNLATYDKGHTFNQSASSGFIELWSLQSKIAHQISKKQEALALNSGKKPVAELIQE